VETRAAQRKPGGAMNPSPGVDLQPGFFGFFATPAFVVTLADADVINATEITMESRGA
jgi:hypothetical protein